MKYDGSMRNPHGTGPFLDPKVFSPMPREVLTMETTDSPLVCQDSCGQRKGYTNLGDADNQWWVAGGCLKPTFLWLKVQGDTVLNLFVGGPLDSAAYATSVLLGEVSMHSLITEYTWTQEIRTSELTGRKARVWRHSSLSACGTVVNAGTTHRQGDMNKMSDNTTTKESTEQAAPAPAPDTSGLEQARAKLGVSRTKISDATGGKLTVAQVYRLERGAGKRTTQEEVDAYQNALRILEAQASEAAAAANTEGTTADNPS